MARMLMIQPQPAPYAGTAYLNGAARSAGHEFTLIMGNDIGLIRRAIEERSPDLIGFSCMTCFCNEILGLAAEVKKLSKAPVILGGPHPTLFPDILNDPSVDMICRGDGEFALLDLLKAIDEKGPAEKIPNLWVKMDGAVHKNEVRRLAEPLDSVPLIDWTWPAGCTRKASGSAHTT